MWEWTSTPWDSERIQCKASYLTQVQGYWAVSGHWYCCCYNEQSGRKRSTLTLLAATLPLILSSLQGPSPVVLRPTRWRTRFISFRFLNFQSRSPPCGPTTWLVCSSTTCIWLITHTLVSTLLNEMSPWVTCLVSHYLTAKNVSKCLLLISVLTSCGPVPSYSWMILYLVNDALLFVNNGCHVSNTCYSHDTINYFVFIPISTIWDRNLIPISQMEKLEFRGLSSLPRNTEPSPEWLSQDVTQVNPGEKPKLFLPYHTALQLREVLLLQINNQSQVN